MAEGFIVHDVMSKTTMLSLMLPINFKEKVCTINIHMSIMLFWTNSYNLRLFKALPHKPVSINQITTDASPAKTHNSKNAYIHAQIKKPP